MNEIIVASLPLETLAEMANEAAEVAQRSMAQAVHKAIDCGRYLQAAKQQVPHGQWASWVGANFDRDHRTATRYMQLATACETRASISDAASIREALRLIADDRATADEPAAIVVEPEPELQEIEAELQKTETEPQERPTIRKVSAESSKVPETSKPKTPEVTPVLVPEADEMVLYHKVGENYHLADADDVAVAALQLYEPMALVRIAVLAVEPKDLAFALDELEQAVKWVRGEIEEAGRD